MRKTAIALLMALTIPGCGAAKSAMGALTGSKPNQVTVVTNVETQPVVVNVQPTPVVVQPAAPKREGRYASLKALAVGAGAGALVGGAVGYAMGGTRGAQQGAAVGAGAGAVSGVAVEAVR
jgi:outer membrane lipoprotein SlyB